jgi:predicted flap endonuclease-1-like 5' DNA nuclease
MAISVDKLRGISADLKEKLKMQGYFNSSQVLEATRIPAGRKALADTLGMDALAALELANRADLARVKGIGGVFSDLLEHAGVDTVRELATRRPDNLYAKMVEVNEAQRVAGRLPTLKAVEDWVAQAKELPVMLEY